jgi:protein TonB
MLLRYSGSATGGAVITAMLIYSMQLLVNTGEVGFAPPKHVRLPIPRAEIAPPTPRVTRDPPIAPEPRTAPPEVPGISTSTQDRDDRPIAPTAPPRIAGRSGGRPGGAGLWLGDNELLPLAQVRPIYPHQAQTRGLEGRVVVEFTVTGQGTVADPHVIESSDPVFDRAALAAVTKFRYQPRIIDGVAVTVPGVRTEFAFRLDN